MGGITTAAAVEDLGRKKCKFSFTSPTLGEIKDGCFLTEVIESVRVGLS